MPYRRSSTSDRRHRPGPRRRLAAALLALVTGALGAIALPAAPAQAAIMTSGLGRMFYYLPGDCLGLSAAQFDARTVNVSPSLAACDGYQRQKWERNGNTQIVSGNGTCLGMATPSALASVVHVLTCNANPSQRWLLEPHPLSGHQYVTTNTAGTRRCMEIRTVSGVRQLWAAPCNGTAVQQFYLDRTSKFRYVALGDSFSAGNGAGNYLDRHCYNSWDNYANKLDDVFREVGKPLPITWPFGPSCGGAQTGRGGLVPWAGNGGGYWSSQVTSTGYVRAPQTGFLNQTLDIPTGRYGTTFNGAETDLVTITIGGNDLGFSGLLTDCVLDPAFPYNCTRNNTEQVVTNATAGLLPRLREIYLDIGKKSPNARIRVLNYPMPVATSDPVWCRAGLDTAEIQMMGRIQGRLNATIRDAVTQTQTLLGTRVQVVDVATRFVGHTACAADPWTTTQAGFDTQEWYHVNARGHLEMARAIRDTL